MGEGMSLHCCSTIDVPVGSILSEKEINNP